MNLRKLVWFGASGLLIVTLFLIRQWNPERQVRLHQRSFLGALEDRDWKHVAKLVSDNYSDRWGHDKEFMLQDAAEVFRQFLVLQVKGGVTDVLMEEGAATIQCPIELRGRGGPLAEFAITRVNALKQPWSFRWEKQSWKPWDWMLIKADQPELEVPDRVSLPAGAN